MKKEFPAVPCNGCTLCCHNDAIRILPADADENYLIEPHPFQPGQFMLAHKANGDCIYLTDTGCGIHERRPQMCREMDCRTMFLKVPKRKAQRLNISMDVWERGRQLQKSNPRPLTEGI